MGGCVATLMDKRNGWSLVDHPAYQDYMQLKKHSEPVPGTETAKSSAIYRMAGTSEEEHQTIVRSYYNSDSTSQRLYKCCKERGDKTALAYRVLQNIERNTVKDDSGTTRTLETFVFEKKRQNMSYTDLWKNIESFGRGLAEVGLSPGSRVAIYEDTRWEWLCSIHGLWCQGMIAVTVYANLGEDALIYALQESQCSAVICNGKNVKNLIRMMDAAHFMKGIIIYLDDVPADFQATHHSVYSWIEIVKKGKSSQVPVRIPTSDNCNDTALIMYTSGTTGNPKGVIHTHGSIAGGFNALFNRVSELLGDLKGTEWYCSYLPMAHIMEIAVSHTLLYCGLCLGFGTPRTLTSTFAKPHGDLIEYQPDVFVGVPRIFDSMKKAVEAKLPKPGTIKRTVFDRAYSSRLRALKEGKDTPVYNDGVFSKVRSVMGGRVRFMLSGGGPMSPSTQEFVNVVFGMIIQGWGLTETICCGGIQRTGNLEYDNVGQPLKSVEVRLLDTPDYKHTDKPDPRGEILLRGPFLFKGYHNQPEQTKEVLDSDGWFHTGDVGSIAENGTLRVVGRVKALAKNSNGEYIALETLEATYGQNILCTPNAVCVLVHPNRSYIAAIALTTEQLAMKFAEDNNISGTFPAILKDPKFHAKATESFQTTARKAGRKSFEVVRHVQLLAEEWTPENDVLTAAMKLKRRVIDVRYKDIIANLFEEDL